MYAIYSSNLPCPILPSWRCETSNWRGRGLGSGSWRPLGPRALPWGLPDFPARSLTGRSLPGLWGESDSTRRSLSGLSVSGDQGRRRPGLGRLEAVAESGGGTRERGLDTTGVARRPGSQTDSSLRPERLQSGADRLTVARPEPQRAVYSGSGSGSGSYPRSGGSPTPPRGDRRPLTPARPSTSRPSSRGDSTPTGRAKTPTRPHSRGSGLSTTPVSSLRSISGGTAKPSNNPAKPSTNHPTKPSTNHPTKPASTSETKSPGTAINSAKLTTRPTTNQRPTSGSGSPSVASGSSVRPVVAASGRRVADLVRGWTEAGEPQRQAERVPATSTGSGGAGRGSTGGAETTEQNEKVRHAAAAAAAVWYANSLSREVICLSPGTVLGFRSFMHSLCIHSSIYSAIHSSSHSFTHSSIHSFIISVFVYSFCFFCLSCAFFVLVNRFPYKNCV